MRALPPGRDEHARAVAVNAPRAARVRFGVRGWLELGLALGLSLGGLLTVALAAGWRLGAADAERTWLTSAEHRQLQRALADPTPTWLDAGPSGSLIVLPAAQPGADDAAPTPPIIVAGPPSSVQLLGARFMFLDPPEPGARARLAIGLQASSVRAGDALDLAFARDWLSGYRITGTQPPATLETTPDGARHVSFRDLPSGSSEVAVDVVATAERVDAPEVKVTLQPAGSTVGTVHPLTAAPRPRPGPVSALKVPRLKMRVPVVPTPWEPPAFVAGQIRDSANITQGNTVLVGHLGGASGDVFKDLDQLRLGDTVTAVSRGLEYTFVVSDKLVRSADDSGPMAPSSSPRLTIMTCGGAWDPLTHNYSKRVWVIAEPWEQAARTISEHAARPPTPVPTAPPEEPEAPSG